MHPYLQGITSPTADKIYLSAEATRRINAALGEPDSEPDLGADEIMLRYKLGGRFDGLVQSSDVLRREPYPCAGCDKTFTPQEWFGVMGDLPPRHIGC